MDHVFARATRFNTDISKWDVAGVVTMSFMFQDASSFNGGISPNFKPYNLNPNPKR